MSLPSLTCCIILNTIITGQLSLSSSRRSHFFDRFSLFPCFSKSRRDKREDRLTLKNWRELMWVSDNLSKLSDSNQKVHYATHNQWGKPENSLWSAQFMFWFFSFVMHTHNEDSVWDAKTTLLGLCNQNSGFSEYSPVSWISLIFEAWREFYNILTIFVSKILVSSLAFRQRRSLVRVVVEHLRCYDS